MKAGPVVANASCEGANSGIFACCRQHAGMWFTGLLPAKPVTKSPPWPFASAKFPCSLDLDERAIPLK
jgi:hypothetical protein